MIFAATLGRSLCQPVADHGTTNAFPERNVGDSLELTMARDLQRHFSAVLTEPLLDFEQGASRNIVVRVTDTLGASFDKAFMVRINDVSPETLFGGPGADTLLGGPLGDFIGGSAGGHIVLGGGGNDSVVGALATTASMAKAATDTITVRGLAALTPSRPTTSRLATSASSSRLAKAMIRLPAATATTAGGDVSLDVARRHDVSLSYRGRRQAGAV
jgi:hypothetical protein